MSTYFFLSNNLKKLDSLLSHIYKFAIEQKLFCECNKQIYSYVYIFISSFFIFSCVKPMVMLLHRGLLHVTLCPRCNSEEETTQHCLRDCEFAKCFWKAIGFMDQTFFQEDTLYGWVRNGIDGPSSFLFLAAVW
jgi:hypothetical protein